MYGLQHFLAGVATLGTFSLALPEAISLRQAVAIPPSQDPFYTPPSGFQTSQLGDILRSRPVPTAISLVGVVPIDVAGSYQLMFRTTDNDGNPAAAVTTVIIPHNATLTNLLAYEVAIDASDVDCAPSYALQRGPNPNTALSQIEFANILAALNRGWCVTLPDFLGLKSAFVARDLTGHTVLDAIRATLKSSSTTQVSSAAKVTVWGYSGGGIASGVAAELQPSYAADLKIVGFVLGGPTPNVANAIHDFNGGVFSGVTVGALWGLANAYPKVGQVLQDHLLPATAAKFTHARDNNCLLQNAAEFTLQDVTSGYFDTDITKVPYISQVLDENNMGKTAPSPSIPLYVYQSINNELSPVQDTDVLVKFYCAGGANVEYVRDTLSEHVSLAATGSPAAVLFLQDRFDGRPTTPGCTTTNVASTLLDARALEVYGQGTLNGLKAIIAAAITPTSIA
ncbi:hypothetical protein LTR09_011598 [Extremus antarcticus]|uniref:Triacylglycerol lipase n=1 Tax=Extremus antarcticus TaxID=702011 RepID=A0AAJ0DBN3_9PEZI|nr:hypothetical protein LTR09_011598 [Extremus antarcticus]